MTEFQRAVGSRLPLNQIWVDQLSFDANLAWDHGELKPEQIRYSASYAVWDEDRRAAARLELKSPRRSKRSGPYVFTMVLWGFFDVANTDVEMGELRAMVKVNGIAILFSYARGVLASATGNGRNGTLLLPTLNFVESEEVDVSGEPTETSE